MASTAALMFADVLGTALFRRLRLELGYSYTAYARYDPLDAEHARILVHVDSTAESTVEVLGTLAEVLSGFSDGDFAATDVADAREVGRERSRHAKLAPDHQLGGVAAAFLMGGDPWHPDDLSEHVDSVSEQDLTEVALEFWDDSIWQTPVAPESATGVTALPPYSTTPVDGEPFVYGRPEERRIFGPAGVSATSPRGVATVEYENCVLALRWPDGARALFGRDSVAIMIEPTLLVPANEKVIAQLDNAVPADTVVWLPARPSEQIPRLSSAPRGLGAWAPVLALALLLIAGLGSSVSLTSGDPERVRNSITGIVFFSIGIVGLMWGWIRRIRWARRQR